MNNYDNLTVTIYALQRVLFHLSEDEQAKQPRYRVHSGYFRARAEARVIVKRRLHFAEQSAAILWEAAKDTYINSVSYDSSEDLTTR